MQDKEQLQQVIFSRVDLSSIADVPPVYPHNKSPRHSEQQSAESSSVGAIAEHWLEQLNVARCRPISDHLHRLSSLSKIGADSEIQVKHITLKQLMAQVVTGRDVLLGATCNLMEHVKPSASDKERLA